MTEGHRHSHDLPQGGLEIPCLMKFTGPLVIVQRLFTVLKALEEEENSICTNVCFSEQ